MWGQAVGQLVAQVSPWNLVAALLWAWLLGAITGWLLPRPKWAGGGSHALLWALPWKNTLLALHALAIVRECWHNFTEPRTFRRLLRAALLFLCGKGWTFDFPSSEVEAPEVATCAPQAADSDNWYVTEKDLAFFQHNAEGSGALPGAGPWEVLMEKEIPNVIKYTCWRRLLPSGKTEYKSLTYFPDATPEEFIDMYFDDTSRPTWDTMIIHNEVLEHGDFSQREQVVRWVRRFPFSFITDREYIIARRLFRLNQDLVACTKVVDHPRAPARKAELVRMDAFYSMWRSRLVPCPWGSNRPATETLLLHHEQFKIPENLGRFAVRHGMWGFIKKLAQTVPTYVADRRIRCDPFSPDPGAFGSGCEPNPPAVEQSLGSGATGGALAPLTPALSPGKAQGGPGMRRCATSYSMASLSTAASADLGSEGGTAAGAAPGAAGEGFSWRGRRARSVSGGSSGGGAADCRNSGSRSSGAKRGKLRSMAAFALASSMALLMHRSSSMNVLNDQPLREAKLRRRRNRSRNMFGSSPALARLVDE